MCFIIKTCRFDARTAASTTITLYNLMTYREHRSVDGHKIVIAMKDTDVFPTMRLCNKAASTICDIFRINPSCDQKRRDSSVATVSLVRTSAENYGGDGDSRDVTVSTILTCPATSYVLIPTISHQLRRLPGWCVTCRTRSIMPCVE